MARLKADLKIGRPPLTILKTSQKSSVNARKKSAKATRKLINRHHQLQKSRSAAAIAGKNDIVLKIDEELDALGGLTAYQAASLTGQDKERGGDSSTKLVDWLVTRRVLGQDRDLTAKPLRVLEVGALSSENAISKFIGHGLDSIKRIDLHSQEPEHIQEVDFMNLPVPESQDGKFDVVSLSLVLNFVPTAVGRGQMLRRVGHFFRQTPASADDLSGTSFLPCLFLVLPLPCFNNSRYMDQDHFNALMTSLGYEVVEVHQSQKLIYMLLHHQGAREVRSNYFPKKGLKSGKKRNNFAIVLT